jgi:hypothetical protein
MVACRWPSKAGLKPLLSMVHVVGARCACMHEEVHVVDTSLLPLKLRYHDHNCDCGRNAYHDHNCDCGRNAYHDHNYDCGRNALRSRRGSLQKIYMTLFAAYMHQHSAP